MLAYPAERESAARELVSSGAAELVALTLDLAKGRLAEDAFCYGMAAGAAAGLSAGTGLCRREDVERLYRQLIGHGSRPRTYRT